ncbi:MAG: radical SAM protein [Nitrospina sp.]|jgi:anaerobic magnesium-protoporphyrin IX monomethyl ester cyclase|nr:radical SAM protein [Nitrospina sp.]MBT4049145.1 radical SAM protein [Nitrospina sp.]MBT4557702.1 radical SAM protein [Nitrospina sp.]MBT6739622.1 radical SAM protein [Nitrospina sp.]MBT7198808.1 radical SAM protein [Nitrospina sp.]
MSKSINPKILFVTTPIRPEPSPFPPIGSLSIISALKREGFENTHFYNIDLLRPDYDQAIAHIKDENPDILAISAVVSTAYEYTKKLSLDIKKALPNITIILGGNLGASAEIVLHKTGVDFVCTGEGEKTMVGFVNRWQETKDKTNFENVHGLAFLNSAENLIITPYSEALEAHQVYDIDWSISEDLDQMRFYVRPKQDRPLYEISFIKDPRANEIKRNEKSVVTMVASKGCVAKCTFCHRWDPGIRYIPVPILMKRIDYFIDNYDVGFIDFGDENFGSDHKWLAEFLKEIKKRDLIWRVSGMRVSTISLEWAIKMKDAGCSAMYFGMESGSQKMLDVMGKVTTVEQNKSVVKWLPANGITTCLQLVLGMPGETRETIEETMEFASFYAQNSEDTDPNRLGLNFAQALPGTPLYEYARRKGLIGSSIEDEEKYLLQISDRDARDGETFINFTDYPRLLLEKWYFDLQNGTRNAFIEKWGIQSYHNVIGNAHSLQILKKLQETPIKRDSGYFAFPQKAVEQIKALEEGSNRQGGSVKDTGAEMPRTEKNGSSNVVGQVSLLFMFFRKGMFRYIPIYFPRFFWRIRFLSVVIVWVNSVKKGGIKNSVKILLEYLTWKISNLFPLIKGQPFVKYISLRRIINKNLVPEISSDNPSMAKLRKGR